MLRLKLLSNKFKVTKPVNLFEELNSDSINETTSRKIYGEDYELLRKMAHYQDTKINSLIVEILLAVEPLFLDFKYDELPKVMRPAYATNSHKSIRIPVKYVEFLDDHAGESKTPIKILISGCIRYYRDHCMSKEFLEMIEFENKKKMEMLRRDIR